MCESIKELEMLWTIRAGGRATNMSGKKTCLMGIIWLEVDKQNHEFYLELHQ
jgi:hypothetical protein